MSGCEEEREQERGQGRERGLSPWPVRAVVFAVMVVVALAAIWLIDRRAMIRMHEMDEQSTVMVSE
jgi:hypothetical protein